MKYRAEIDGLRALAVIPVILFHAGIGMFGGGFVGVDIFFVISGYLITKILLDELQAGRFSLLKFYERRARRILPALFLVVMITLPFAWLLLTPSDLKDFAQSLIGVATFSSNILFWMESGYFDTAAELKPMLHTWSLAVEEQYYILFPVFLMAVWRYGRTPLLLSLLVMFFCSLGLAHWLVFRDPSAAFYLLPTRGWEILLGAFCAMALKDDAVMRHQGVNQYGSLLGLALIIYAIFMFEPSTPSPSLYTLLPTGGTAMLILFARPGTWVNRILCLPPMVGVGLISYSAYLWHQPLIALSKYQFGNELGVPVILGLFSLTLLLAWLSWKYVEAPFRSKRFSQTRIFQFGLSTLAVTFMVGCLGHFRILSSFVELANPNYVNQYVTNQPWQSSACEDFVVMEGEASCQKSGLGTYKIVVWGDSYANMLRRTTPILPEVQLVNITHSGCPPLAGVRRFDGRGNSVNCLSLSTLQTYAEYIHQLQPDLIILVGRWNLYLHGWVRDGVLQPQHHLITDESVPSQMIIADELTRLQVLERAMMKTIKLFGDTSVVVMDQPPDYGIFSFRQLFMQDAIEVEKLKAWDSNSRELMQRLTRQGINVLRAKQVFCDSVQCKTRLDGVLLYHDDNHLNDLGSMQLWQKLLTPYIQSSLSLTTLPALSQ